MVPPVHVEIVSSSQDQTCVFVLCHKDGAGQVEEALRGIGFARPSNPTKLAPTQRKQELDEKIAQAQKEIEQAEQKMISFADKRAEIRFAIDYFTMRAEKYAVIGELAQSKRAFVLTGYILAKKADRLKNELEKDNAAQIILALSNLYNQLRQQRLVKCSDI